MKHRNELLAFQFAAVFAAALALGGIPAAVWGSRTVLRVYVVAAPLLTATAVGMALFRIRRIYQRMRAVNDAACRMASGERLMMPPISGGSLGELAQTLCALEKSVAATNRELTHKNRALQAQIEEKESIEAALNNAKSSLQNIFDNTYAGIVYMGTDSIILDCNEAYARLYGYTREEMIGTKVAGYSANTESYMMQLESIRGGRRYILLEDRRRRRDGSEFYIEGSIACACSEGGRPAQLCGIVNDVSNRKLAERELVQSHMQYLNLFNSMHCGLAMFRVTRDEDGYMRLVYTDVNPAYIQIFGKRQDELIGCDLRTTFPEGCEEWVDVFTLVASSGKPKTYEATDPVRQKYLKAYVYRPQELQVAVLVFDTTEEKRKSDTLEFLNYHDKLTGLFNRAYCDKQMELIDASGEQAGIVIGDVNGLKITNDVFGHEAGDRLLTMISDILSDSCRAGDIAARWGGDEFILLLPGAGKADAEAVCRSIYTRCASFEFNEDDMRVAPSISLGGSAKTASDQRMDDVLKEAEEYMYKRKLLESRSLHSSIVSSILNALYIKGQITEEDSERLRILSLRLAAAMDFDEHESNDMVLLSMLHDIGNITVRQELFSKKEPLTPDEMDEIRRHAEAGYRIARSAGELAPIANLILNHHEWWNGHGYPQGLAGKNIPLMSRMIAVVVAYDAMIVGRPYRGKMTIEKACEELRRCAGTQFDPEVVKIFIGKVIQSKKQPAVLR